MDYATSNECRLWIDLWPNKRQRRVNDSGLCVLGNFMADWLQIVINAVFTAVLGKRESETLSAQS
jgi:hypothetical protein